MSKLPLQARQTAWLVRRELWEARRYLLTAPVLGSLLIFLVMSPLVHLLRGWDIRRNFDLYLEWSNSALTPMASPAYVWMMWLALTFYCVHALQNERNDRSILFWKSVPVSDLQTVLSKAAVALMVVPLWAVAIEIGVQALSQLWIAGLMKWHGYHEHAATVLSPASYPRFWPDMGAYLARTMLWALPNVAWLLMISTWARSYALLWGIGLPLGVAGVSSVIDWSLGTDIQVHVWSVAMRLLAGLGPIPHQHMLKEITKDWQTRPDLQHLNTPHLIGGIVAGIVMLAIAVRLRRRNAEL